jgi:glycosyltransferase involved in cell wall biosynthesis
MNLAIDTNCILPGRVGGIENYTLGLIEALKLPQSPVSSLLLLTRAENHGLFSRFADERTKLELIERPTHNGQPIGSWADLMKRDPAGGRKALEAFGQRKADLLRRRHVALIHFPGNTINPLELDLPVVLNLHDLQHRHFPQYFTQAELEDRENWWVASARRADALIAASNYVRDDLVQQLGIKRARIFVTPDAFQSAYLQAPPQGELDELRVRLGLSHMFFLYPAAAWPHKNHQRLIEAFLKANIPGAELVLTGGGQADSMLGQLIDDRGARQRVRLLGRVSTDELVALYHLATALIFPSEHEAWSIPMMEAMACGCPIACSNVTSLPEELGDAGLLFGPRDVDAMADAMLRLARDRQLRQVLAERGKRRVSDFSPANFLRGIRGAYEYALQSRSLPKAA